MVLLAFFNASTTEIPDLLSIGAVTNELPSNAVVYDNEFMCLLHVLRGSVACMFRMDMIVRSCGGLLLRHVSHMHDEPAKDISYMPATHISKASSS